MVVYPPSQTEIPMNPAIHQEPNQESQQQIRPPPVALHQENPRFNSKKNTPEGQSIIMQLYTSQDNNVLAPNAPIG